ncbi:MAG: hypothetical protein UU05_C0054G0006 [Candidatus Curtissbacteria bacterium GW2011_GWA1_40_47]|uniref:Uncharacterized protein n=1 Tax=Candidatus Curtissbacteria bacterium RIFOXYA1_FULL_41_14 TaxID=1797737 RepID=A0A1F5HFI5_9BACT|nr:MAG: hypothetical protein UT99_C0034G0003 [Candidatus Curtissbacteria bacterium GW2011_GWA2_40_31]KKR64186.1 MAG: hypothetical protein UU05_C0054G0006 [Candidatus Curtissbacteria bacterium GW2011_GWA1_40_47]OGD92348.1 MAG: hypothetical protein A3E14_04240 [Candidatus Curtissbacteria bacterium RIFCSPHIGHO2_12_FULL_41_13]OGE02931.1 MAG: hypothetical protein A2196_03670 [Candidatus Curtissbacteria bacterium RIFOXYA1_FULL_41_14]OGE09664.1 MAG: hypothetical protein A2470_00830 [Candidatus Curtiss
MDTGKSKKQNLSTNNIKSSILKMGAKTIFFDVNLAANDKKYLKITESRFTGEGNDRVRSSVVLFPENIEGFEKGLKEVVGYLN